MSGTTRVTVVSATVRDARSLRHRTSSLMFLRMASASAARSVPTQIGSGSGTNRMAAHTGNNAKMCSADISLEMLPIPMTRELLVKMEP